MSLMNITILACHGQVRRTFIKLNLADPLKAPLGVCCDNCQCRIVDAEASELIEQSSAACTATLKLDANTDVELTDDELADDREELITASDMAPTSEGHAKRRDPSILPQRQRGAHLLDAQTSLELWRLETWSRFYAGRPWSPEILLPTGVINNIANKTYILSIEALIDIGGWSRHRALHHGEELLSILQGVDEHERDQRISEKEKMLDDRRKRKCAADAARDAKKAETKKWREEERLSRPKRPRASRAKKATTTVGHVAAEIGPGKENVPLSSQGMPALHPMVSCGVVPFTPTRLPSSVHPSPSSSSLSPSTMTGVLSPPVSFNMHAHLPSSAHFLPSLSSLSPSTTTSVLSPPASFNTHACLPSYSPSPMHYTMLPPNSSPPVFSQAPPPIPSAPFWIPPFVAQNPPGPPETTQPPSPLDPLQTIQPPQLYPPLPGVWRYPTWP